MLCQSLNPNQLYCNCTFLLLINGYLNAQVDIISKLSQPSLRDIITCVAPDYLNNISPTLKMKCQTLHLSITETVSPFNEFTTSNAEFDVLLTTSSLYISIILHDCCFMITSLQFRFLDLFFGSPIF